LFGTYARRRRLGVRVADTCGIALVGDRLGDRVGQTKPVCDLSEHNGAAVRRQPAAVELGCDSETDKRGNEGDLNRQSPIETLAQICAVLGFDDGEPSYRDPVVRGRLNGQSYTVFQCSVSALKICNNSPMYVSWQEGA